METHQAHFRLGMTMNRQLPAESNRFALSGGSRFAVKNSGISSDSFFTDNCTLSTLTLSVENSDRLDVQF